MSIYRYALTPTSSINIYKIGFIDCLVFLIPTVQFLEIGIVGRLFASDILLICLFPIMFYSKSHYLKNKEAKTFIILGLLWLSSQVATDMILSTPFEDYARGWAKTGLFIIHFMTLYMLIYDKYTRIYYFAIGMVIGGLLDYYISPNLGAANLPWKFGYGASISLAVFLISVLFYRSGYILTISIIFFISFLNLYLGFRSAAGIYFLVAFFIFIVNKYDLRKFSDININFMRLVPLFILSLIFLSGIFLYFVNYKLIGIVSCFLALSICLFRQSNIHKNKNIVLFLNKMLVIGIFATFCGLLFYQSYKYLATQGILGLKEKQKISAQTGRYGSFVGGRSEMLISLRAIADSPIIGHGSWAKDIEYVQMYQYLLDQLGYNKGFVDTDVIPSHSHIFGAWVEAGLLGAVFWGWILYFLIKSLLRLVSIRAAITSLLALFCFSLVWSILFSPYGAETRFIETYQIACIMAFLAFQTKHKKA